MSHINKGDSKTLMHGFEFQLHLFSHLQIQRSQRFIKKQDIGSLTMARAIAILCCCPPDRVEICLFSNPLQIYHFQYVFHLLIDH